jgi:DNA-directed RNA polymerase I, II, and III subunit RPABC3
MSFILFEDIVEVQRVDDKHFNKVGELPSDVRSPVRVGLTRGRFLQVSRCHCKSDNFDLEIKLDVNTEAYPVTVEDRLNLAIASSLSLDDKPDEGQYDQSKNKSR